MLEIYSKWIRGPISTVTTEIAASPFALVTSLKMPASSVGSPRSHSWLDSPRSVPGTTLLDIAGAVEDHVKANQFSVVEDYTGHGVGRNLHEEPSVFNFRTNDLPNVKLRPGMTLAVEPILNAGSNACRTLKDRWTVVTKDGSLSAQWEHTIVVTSDGCEILTDRGD